MVKLVSSIYIVLGIPLILCGVLDPVGNNLFGVLLPYLLGSLFIVVGLFGLHQKESISEIVRMDYETISDLYYKLAIVYGVTLPGVFFRAKSNKYLGQCDSQGNILFYGAPYLSTVLHEFAHHIQFRQSGKSNHRRDFRRIVSELEAWVSVFGIPK